MTGSIRIPASFDTDTRILGTITVKQAIRAGTPPLAVFLNAYPSITISTLPALSLALGAGILWAYWKPHGRHLDQHLYNSIQLLTAERPENTFTPERKDDYIRTGYGSAAAVIQVDPVNLELKTRDQQAALHQIQQDLISTVNYPIEIHSRQQDLDLSQYVNHLENLGIEGTDLGQLYLDAVQKFSEARIPTTQHYVTVKARPNNKAGISRLTQQIRNTLSKSLNQLYKPLQAEEAESDPSWETSEIHKCSGPVLAELNSRCREITDVLDAGNLSANRLEKQELDNILNTELRLDETGNRASVAVTEFPSSVDIAWTADLLRSPGYTNITQIIQPQNPAKTSSRLQRLSEKLNAEINSLRIQGYHGTNRLQGILEDIEWMLDLLANREDKPVKYGVYITAHHEDPDSTENTLQQACNWLETHQFDYLNDTRVKPKAASTNSLFQSSLWEKEQLMPASSAAAGFPYATQTIEQESGVYYGQDTSEDTPILLDRYDWSSHSMAWMGTPGSGKSYAAKIELVRSWLAYQDLQIIIVDPKKEYKHLGIKNGRSRTTLEEGKDYSFNKDIRRFEPEDIGDNNTQLLIDAVRQIYSYTTSNTRKTLVVIDEAHQLLDAKNEEGRILLSKFIREARSSNTAVNLITQNASDFTDHRRGRKILDNIPGKVFMRHERVSDSVVDYFDFSNREKQELYQLKTGTEHSYSEALLRVSNRVKSKIKVEATAAEKAGIEAGDPS